MPAWIPVSAMDEAGRTGLRGGIMALSVYRSHRILHHLAAHRPALMGAGVLLVLVLACAGVSWVSPYDSEKSSMQDRYLPPSRLHPMGTDDLGRDLLTRILYGGRVSLAVGFLATLLGLGLGLGLGAMAGLQGGWADNVIMRVADAFLALPRIFVLILMTLFLRNLGVSGGHWGSGVGGIILVLGLLSWMGVARQVRSQLLVLKEGDFIMAAWALGVPVHAIVLRHLLPNALTPVIVAATLRIAGAVMAESGLSFLGFGVQPPTPTWGNLLTHGQDEMLKGHFWLVLFPGLMIFLTVIAINFVGDGLRDALDPRKGP